ncbi:hypothetical protein ACWEO2_37120 [Nocardia sp. NPDC004278]
MPASAIALIVTVAAICLLAVVVWTVTRLPDTYPEGAITAADILERVASEGTLRTDSWELEPSHRAPAEPYTPEQAHAEMQRHRECSTALCPAKHSAFWTLVDVGQAVPDARAVR